jgi:hypothetical protein
MEMTAGVAPARLTSLPSCLMNQTAVRAHRLVAEGLAAADARPLSGDGGDSPHEQVVPSAGTVPSSR